MACDPAFEGDGQFCLCRCNKRVQSRANRKDSFIGYCSQSRSCLGAQAEQGGYNLNNQHHDSLKSLVEYYEETPIEVMHPTLS